MRRRSGLVLVVACATGCATAGSRPELITARRALARAQERAVGRYAPYELKRAEAALAQAEAAERAAPRSDVAAEEAIAAERASEKARVASRLARGVEALEHASRRADRLRVNVERSEQAARERERRERDDTRSRAERRRAQVDALAKLQGLVGDVRQDDATSTLVVPARVLFVLGTSKLRPGALMRLNAIAHALAEGPSYRVRVDVSASSMGLLGTTSRSLAKQRAMRLREVLQDCGVPFENLEVTHRAGELSLIRMVVSERSSTSAPSTSMVGR
jgi:outer membrane protein OmpA-like peptidoglycan-associated protein